PAGGGQARLPGQAHLGHHPGDGRADAGPAAAGAGQEPAAVVHQPPRRGAHPPGRGGRRVGLGHGRRGAQGGADAAFGAVGRGDLPGRRARGAHAEDLPAGLELRGGGAAGLPRLRHAQRVRARGEGTVAGGAAPAGPAGSEHQGGQGEGPLRGDAVGERLLRRVRPGGDPVRGQGAPGGRVPVQVHAPRARHPHRARGGEGELGDQGVGEVLMLAEGTPIGKYVVRRKIAEGGMAEIYLASSRGPEGFEKDVAIKRIRPFLAGDEQFVQMFIAEARVASRLNHANLVQVFEFDKHQDTFYLAMELVRGHSLWDVRRRAKEMVDPMSPTLVAHVGAEVARGLGYAHRLADKGKPLNLVHRDVTPHNVLLSFDGAVKLADFGVAKHSASSTAAGVLKGKFAYMSPEQSRGEPLDARTDLFALGIVLWEMLTGGRLFDGDSDVAVLRAVQSSAIAPPSRLNPDVPEALSAVVMKALERDPAQRYQDGQEMERALAGFVLSHAKSVDDTDLGAYLRKLYAEELAQEARVPAPEGGAEPPPRKEPTAQVGAAAA